MTGPERPMEARVRLSSVLVLIGLAIEAISLMRVHPLAFVAFTVLGCGAMTLGFALFLLGLLRTRR